MDSIYPHKFGLPKVTIATELVLKYFQQNLQNNNSNEYTCRHKLATQILQEQFTTEKEI